MFLQPPFLPQFPFPGGGGQPGMSPIHQKAVSLIGRTVGVSLRNGQGVSGVLCSVRGRQIFLLQFLYQSQFATFHYDLSNVADINPFPRCQHGPVY
jgi:hypothetical protein